MSIFSITTPIVDPLGAEGAVASALNRDVEPFVATVLGYDSITLSWSMPSSSVWYGIRIVHSRSGYPRRFDDGDEVLNYVNTDWRTLPSAFEVSGLTGGWHYFSVFLKDNFGVWNKVSQTDGLVPFDYGSTDLMWDNIPEYYKAVRDDTADISLVNLRINADLYDDVAGGSQPNNLLSAFIAMFGWGFDLLRTEVDYLNHGYDPTVIHPSRLRLLANQFGHEPENSVPAHTNRTIVRNLSSLYRKRGTMEGIKDTVTSVSGWDVDVVLGPNLLLTEDQSGHVNPAVPSMWIPSVKYTTGNLVRYGDFTFQALSTNLNTPPPTTATSSATWTYLDYPRALANGSRADTGDISSWQARLSGVAGTGAVSGNTKVVAGAPDPLGGTKRQTNAMQVFRTGTDGSGWIDVVSVPALSNPLKPSQQFILESGIPLPKPSKWVITRDYRFGDYVVYKGAAYRALNDNPAGVLPTSATDWVRVGADDRVSFTSSTYAHGPFVGTGGTGGKTVTPRAWTYDAAGNIVRLFEYTSATTDIPYFDTFVDDNVAFTNVRRAQGTYQLWSTDNTNAWTVDRDDNGGWVTPAATGKTHRWFVTSANHVNLAVTYTVDPGTTRLAGIILRRSDSSNYWISSQTGLYKVVAGAARANPASGALTWTKFNAGERMRVVLNGSDISVYRNGVLLGTATDSFNSTTYNHGLGAEA